MKRRLTVESASVLRRHFMWAAVIVAALALAARAIGLGELFLPLAIVCWILMARSLQWDGWITGYRSGAADTNTQEEAPPDGNVR